MAVTAFRQLFQPLSIAAYITWLAVFIALAADLTQDVPAWRQQLAVALMMAFLLTFGVLTWRGTKAQGRNVLLALEGAIAVGLCGVWPDELALPVLTIILMAQCASTMSGRALAGAALVLNVLLWWIFESYWTVDRPWATVLIFGGFQLFAVLTAWYARQAEEAASVLQQTNAHLLTTRSLLEATARDQERLRVARELHDVAGHKLTALKLNLTVAKRDANTEVAASIEISARLATELLEDVRAVVAQFRQADGVDLREPLMQLATVFPTPRVHLDFGPESANGFRVNTVEQAEALIRAVQEALTNIARHAKASNAWIALRRDGDSVHLQIHDDGRSPLQVREGHGLTGMRERLSALGGLLCLSRTERGGLVLTVSVPLS